MTDLGGAGEVGKGEILELGKDVAIIALGHMYKIAKETRNLLLENDIESRDSFFSHMIILDKDKINENIVEPVISNLKVYTTDSKIIMELISTSEQDLSLEKWSLENCASIVHDSCGKNLHVNV